MTETQKNAKKKVKTPGKGPFFEMLRPFGVDWPDLWFWKSGHRKSGPNTGLNTFEAGLIFTTIRLLLAPIWWTGHSRPQQEDTRREEKRLWGGGGARWVFGCIWMYFIAWKCVFSAKGCIWLYMGAFDCIEMYFQLLCMYLVVYGCICLYKNVFSALMDVFGCIWVCLVVYG